MGLATSLELPFQGARAARAAGGGAPLEGVQVLLLGFSGEPRRAMSSALLGTGAVVVAPLAGGRDLDLFLEVEPDVVAFRLPAGGGSSAEELARLRSDERLADVPVLAVAANAEPARLLRLLDDGFDDFVVEPLLGRVLVARLAVLAGRRRLVLENRRLLANVERFASRAAAARDLRRTPVEHALGAVLSCELRGLATTSAPAPVAGARDTCVAQQRDIVRHWGGCLDGASQHGVLAIFTDEQGPWLAARAALEIVHCALSWGEGLTPGIGLHYGEILRAVGAPGEHGECTALGRDVNLAARLGSLAQPLQVMVTEAFGARLDGRFELGPARTVPVSGYEEPVQVWALEAWRRRVAQAA